DEARQPGGRRDDAGGGRRGPSPGGASGPRSGGGDRSRRQWRGRLLAALQPRPQDAEGRLRARLHWPAAAERTPPRACRRGGAVRAAPGDGRRAPALGPGRGQRRRRARHPGADDGARTATAFLTAPAAVAYPGPMLVDTALISSDLRQTAQQARDAERFGYDG